MAAGFRKADTGITSAVGTGMMIAIAILLAVGLTIMARVFSDQDEETPPVTFSKDETMDSIRVLHAETGFMHSEFEVRLSMDGDFEAGGPVQPGGDALTADRFVPLGG